MKRLLLAGIFFLWFGSAIGQVKVTIIDKGSGKTVEGVALYLKDSEPTLLAISNQSGLAEIKLDKFPATVVTSHISYTAITFEISSPNDVSIQLEPAVTTLKDVVVTGQYAPTSVRNSVYKVRVIDGERITTQGASRLQDVLSTELNVRFSQDAATGVSNISMQGLSGQNVKILIDGVPVIGRQGPTNAMDINQLNLNSIDRIEIVEGPMSTIYGADALAGVINIITKKSAQDKFSASVRIHEETVGNEYSLFKKGIHQEGISLGYKQKSFYSLIDFAHNYSGGWKGDSVGREKAWHPKGQWIGSSTVGIQKENWNVSYRLDFLNEDLYDPSQYFGDEALDRHYKTTRFMHQLQGATTFSDKLSFNGAVAYTDYSRKTQVIVVDKNTGEQTLALSGQELMEYAGTTIRGTFQYKISDKVSLQPGYDINLESASGGRLVPGTNRLTDYAGFISAEIKPFSFLSIRPGLRFVKNSVYQAPPALPSVNTKFTLSQKHDLRVSYGRGFRAPSLRELYFYFYESNHPPVEGNPNLEAELSHSFNASWNWYLIKTAIMSYTSTISGFYNSVDNMIGYVPAASGNGVTTYDNIDKYKTKGLTWNQVFQANKLNIKAGVAYTEIYNRYNSENSSPEFTSTTEVNGTVSYNFLKTGITASVFYKFTGRTPFYEPNGSTIRLAETDSYHWADFTLQKKFMKHVTLNVGVRNLFDITTVRSTSIAGTHSGGGPGTIGSGRSYFTTLTINL